MVDSVADLVETVVGRLDVLSSSISSSDMLL